jgi:hypothetical protein
VRKQSYLQGFWTQFIQTHAVEPVLNPKDINTSLLIINIL